MEVIEELSTNIIENRGHANLEYNELVRLSEINRIQSVNNHDLINKLALNVHAIIVHLGVQGTDNMNLYGNHVVLEKQFDEVCNRFVDKIRVYATDFSDCYVIINQTNKPGLINVGNFRSSILNQNTMTE